MKVQKLPAVFVFLNDIDPSMSITANATGDACSSTSGHCSPLDAAALTGCTDGRSPTFGCRDSSLSGFSLDAYLIGENSQHS